MNNSDDEAVIIDMENPKAEETEVKTAEEKDDLIVSDEEEYDEEEYIKASRFSFDLHKDHFIFDFNDVDPESDNEMMEENVEEEENEENDENEEEEEENEEENEEEVELSEQQNVMLFHNDSAHFQEQAEMEAREAVKKNVTRRMGWFDMLRRLEKKVTNGIVNHLKLRCRKANGTRWRL